MSNQVMAATLVVLALALFLLAARSRKKTGIPAREVFYQDLPGQPFFGEPLRSDALDMPGASRRRHCVRRIEEFKQTTGLRRSLCQSPDSVSRLLRSVEDQMKVRVPYALVI